MKKFICVVIFSLCAFVLCASEKNYVEIKVYNETGVFIDNIYYGKSGIPKIPNTINIQNHQFVVIQLEFNETYIIRMRDNEGNFYDKTDVRFSSISNTREIYIKNKDKVEIESTFLDKILNKNDGKEEVHEPKVEKKSKSKSEKKKK